MRAQVGSLQSSFFLLKTLKNRVGAQVGSLLEMLLLPYNQNRRPGMLRGYCSGHKIHLKVILFYMFYCYGFCQKEVDLARAEHVVDVWKEWVSKCNQDPVQYTARVQ